MYMYYLDPLGRSKVSRAILIKPSSHYGEIFRPLLITTDKNSRRRYLGCDAYSTNTHIYTFGITISLGGRKDTAKLACIIE